MLNLVEAYIKYNKKLVIFISGLSGCGKTNLSKKLSQLLHVKLLEQNNYYKKNYNKITTLPNSRKLINRNTDDAIDWDKLNLDLKKYSPGGVILSGFGLPQDLIKIKPDYFISLAIKKDDCLDKRIKFINKNKEKFKREYSYLQDGTEKLIMNLLVFPYFLSCNKRSKIDINISVVSNSQVYKDSVEALFNTLFTQEHVEKLYWNYK